jgi:hypothetical protein
VESPKLFASRVSAAPKSEPRAEQETDPASANR